MNDRQYQKTLRRLDVLEQREPPLAAEFVTTATDPSDEMLVIVTGWDDGEHTFGPVRWSPIGGALPQAGDEAVIVERDDGVWQVVAWWNDSQGTGVAQGTIDALVGTSKTALPYASGWADYGSGQEAGTYSKHGKTVIVQGAFTRTGGAPSAGLIIATLPTGHRPTGEIYVTTVTGPSGNTFGAVSIQADGDIVWRAGSVTETDFSSFATSFDVD